MKYFVVADADADVAVVFHDYTSGYYCCRSSRRSFYEAFTAAIDRTRGKLVKKANSVVIKAFGCHDFDWVERVLFETCGEYWRISYKGDVVNDEVAVDEIVVKYLK